MTLLTREQLDGIKRFDGPTICNALEFFGLRPNSAGFMWPGMQQRTMKGTRMIGYAATAKVSARHPGGPEEEKIVEAYYRQVAEMHDPTVSVIQDIDPQPTGSFWGEVQSTIHLALGGIGTLTRGGVRDVPESEAAGFAFFSTELHISHAYVHVVDQCCPVEVCGLTVRPGDLLYADCHGAVSIPHEAAPRLADACQAVIEAERPLLDNCRKAAAEGKKPAIGDLMEWRKLVFDRFKIATERFGR